MKRKDELILNNGLLNAVYPKPASIEYVPNIKIMNELFPVPFVSILSL